MAQSRPKHKSRRAYIKALATGSLASVAGCLGGQQGDGSDGTDASDGETATATPNIGVPPNEEYTIGYSPLYMADDWMTTWVKAGQWWAEDHGINLTVSNPGADPAKQFEQNQKFLQTDVDGIVLSPVDSAASAKIVDNAADQDVPVILSNTMSVNPKSKMFIAFDNYSAASVMAERTVEHLEEKYGEPRGKVFHIMGPLSLQTLVQRRDGFNDVLAEYSDIEVESVETNALREDSQKKTTNFLQTIDPTELDAIYAHNPNMMLGGLSGLEQAGIKKKRGEENHVYATLFAANPPITDAILDGFVDAAINQGPTQYGPIALMYMVKYLDSGKDDAVFPEIGSQVTLDDLKISGGKHLGVDPWEPAETKQYWAPADIVDVTEFFPSAEGSYPYFKSGGFVVDETNADSEWLWGNLARKYE